MARKWPTTDSRQSGVMIRINQRSPKRGFCAEWDRGQGDNTGQHRHERHLHRVVDAVERNEASHALEFRYRARNKSGCFVRVRQLVKTVERTRET